MPSCLYHTDNPSEIDFNFTFKQIINIFLGLSVLIEKKGMNNSVYLIEMTCANVAHVLKNPSIEELTR